MPSNVQTVLDIVNIRGVVNISELKKFTNFSEVQLYNLLHYLDKTKRIKMVKDGWNSIGKSLSTTTESEAKKSFSDEASEILMKHFGATAAKLLENKIVPIFEKKLEELTDELAARFANQLRERTDLIMEHVMKKTETFLQAAPISEQEAIPPIVSEQKVVKKKLLKVCVLGLKPNQQGSIAADFGQSFNLMFWNEHTGSSVEQLTQYAKSCEAFFIHTKHIGHNAQQILAGANIVYCNGGVTHMKHKLMEYYKEVTA